VYVQPSELFQLIYEFATHLDEAWKDIYEVETRATNANQKLRQRPKKADAALRVSVSRGRGSRLRASQSPAVGLRLKRQPGSADVRASSHLRMSVSRASTRSGAAPERPRDQRAGGLTGQTISSERRLASWLPSTLLRRQQGGGHKVSPQGSLDAGDKQVPAASMSGNAATCKEHSHHGRVASSAHPGRCLHGVESQPHHIKQKS
jgi:hypothetical protein